MVALQAPVSAKRAILSAIGRPTRPSGESSRSVGRWIKEWFYVNGAGKTVGPVSGGSIRNLLRSNPNWKKVHVWSEGYSDWTEAGKAPEFEELTRAAPPRPPLKSDKTRGVPGCMDS